MDAQQHMSAPTHTFAAGTPALAPPVPTQNGATLGSTWRSFSTRSKAALVSIAAVCLFFMIVDPSNVVGVAIAIIPPVFILRFVYVRYLRDHCEPGTDDTFVRMAFSSFLPVALLTVIVEFMLLSVSVLIFLSSEISSVTDDLERGATVDEAVGKLRFGPGVFFLALFTAFITAALVEESAKVLVVRKKLCVCSAGGTPGTVALPPLEAARRRAFTTVALFLAASLGFSFGENLLYICTSGDSSTGSFGQRVVFRLFLGLMRGLLSMPVHLTCAAFTALRVTFRDVQLAHNANIQAQQALANVAASAGQAPYTMVAMPGVVSSGAVSATGSSPATVRVWSWPRIMWPAIMIHGTFNAQLMLLSGGAALAREIGLLVLALVFCTIIVGVSVWILRQQFLGVFDHLAAGQPPAGLTLGVTWHCKGRPPAPTILTTGVAPHLSAVVPGVPISIPVYGVVPIAAYAVDPPTSGVAAPVAGTAPSLSVTDSLDSAPRTSFGDHSRDAQFHDRNRLLP